MKLNIVFPWICVLGLGAGLGAVYLSGRAKDTELASLRDESQKAQATRDELEQVKGETKVLQDENAKLRLDTQELLRLRSEVSKLRDDKDALNKQVVAAKSEAQRAQNQISQTTQAGAQQLQQLQSENLQLRNVASQNQQNAQRIVCLNNLRQLEGAKQQWALQNNQPAGAVPMPQDLAPYLKDNIMPTCPAGGTYTLNAVGQQVTCSVASHVLSR